MTLSTYRLFAVSPPGIEDITLKELEALGIKGKKQKGGVYFKGGLKEIYQTNLWLRSATRVLLRVARFRARSFYEFEDNVKRYPWDLYFPNTCRIRLRVTSIRSRLYHTNAIKERFLRYLHDKLKYPILETDDEDEGTAVVIRFKNDICTISVSTSGKPLYKRGYKIFSTNFTLRENLAASMIIASGWDQNTPLIDPFCGVGTIVIEAAMIAACIAPGIYRDFAFMNWKNFNAELFEKVRENARSCITEPKQKILGFDRDTTLVNYAIQNSKKANVNSYISFINKSFPKVHYNKATIVTNPPYGIRSCPDENIHSIFIKLSTWIVQNFNQAGVAILSPSLSYIRAMKGLRGKDKLLSFSNGGIRVTLYKLKFG